jgi:nucleoside-diphosphate-sugar epimerase
VNILITGINGFLGRNLIRILEGNVLIGLDIEEGEIDGVPIFSSRNIQELSFPVDVVIMCHASVSSGTYHVENDLLYNVNVRVTRSIVEKYSKASLIYVSTTSIYDPTDDVITEISKEKPLNSYSLSKLWGEHEVLKSHRGVVLRLSSMFGRDMKQNTIIPNYVNQAIEFGKITVWGDGSRLQNYIHVDEVGRYIQKIIQSFDKCTSKILLGVSSNECSNKELAELISSIRNASICFAHEDTSVSVHFNNRATNSLLNYVPSLNLENRLIEYISWKENA